MAKKSRRKVTFPRWRPKFVGALVLGVALLAIGALLWQQFADTTFNDRLLRKMPKDSVSAGVARLSAVEPAQLRQYAKNTNVYAKEVNAMMDALDRGGVTLAELDDALEDQFAWARTPGGTVALFTVENEGRLREVADKLGDQLTGRRAAEIDGLKADTGTLSGTGPVVIAVSGRELYVSSDAALIQAAHKEESGFTSLPDFAALSGDLPPVSGGYTFFNTTVAKTKLGIGSPLVGIAWSPRRDDVSLVMRTAGTTPVQQRLDRTDGSLLPGTDLAIGGIEGVKVADYLRLLEEQRQETELPKVLALQNGLASLSRQMGTDFTGTYLEAADGKFVYARYAAAGNKPGWFALAEFPSAEAARSTTTRLMDDLHRKVRVPLRREVVRVLPDGTQSREVVAQGPAPITFADFSVAGRQGKTTNIPSIGAIYLVTQDKYLVVANSPDGVQRMLTSLGREGQEVRSKGPLAVRLKVSEAYRLMAGERDVLFDWVMATRPSGGRFLLEPSGELSGSLEFR